MFGDVVFKFHLCGGFRVHDAGRQLIPMNILHDFPVIREPHDLIGGKNIIPGQSGSVFGFALGFHRQFQCELRTHQPNHRSGRALRLHPFNRRFLDLDVCVLQVNARVFHLLDG